MAWPVLVASRPHQGRKALGSAQEGTVGVGQILPMLQTRNPCRGTGKKGLINCWIVIASSWRRTPKRWWSPAPQPETLNAGQSPGHFGVSCQIHGMSSCSRTDPHVLHYREHTRREAGVNQQAKDNT